MIKYILKRVLILIVPIVLFNVIHFITFDEHARCIGDKHRHVDGYIGIFLLSMLWLSTCGPILFIQTIFEFFKRRKQKD